MSFYGMLRRFYPAFATFWVCLIRLFFWYGLQVRSHGCGFIFITQFLNIVNPAVTAVVTLVTQTLVNNIMYYGGVFNFNADTLMFDTFFTILLTVIAYSMKANFTTTKLSGKTQDPVLQCLIAGVVTYTVMVALWPKDPTQA